jgi:hypothetical protein
MKTETHRLLHGWEAVVAGIAEWMLSWTDHPFIRMIY